MQKKYKISVVIPVFNEQDSLRPLIDRLIHVLEPFKPCEIILVNDGSTDGSEAVLESLHNEFVDIVRIIHLRTNCGKSVALQCGFKEVSGELIVMMDVFICLEGTQDTLNGKRKVKYMRSCSMVF
tara:strand:+ start:96 stop:470 length:375 start_codon:yes stop_codon:yes gene_type:complete